MCPFSHDICEVDVVKLINSIILIPCGLVISGVLFYAARQRYAVGSKRLNEPRDIKTDCGQKQSKRHNAPSRSKQHKRHQITAQNSSSTNSLSKKAQKKARQHLLTLEDEVESEETKSQRDSTNEEEGTAVPDGASSRGLSDLSSEPDVSSVDGLLLSDIEERTSGSDEAGVSGDSDAEIMQQLASKATQFVYDGLVTTTDKQQNEDFSMVSDPTSFVSYDCDSDGRQILFEPAERDGDMQLYRHGEQLYAAVCVRLPQGMHSVAGST